MKRRVYLIVALLVIAVVLTATLYWIWRTGPPPTNTVGEGFLSFYTPRDFDEIGTVIEVTKDGTWFRLGKLALDPDSLQSAKAESVPTYEAHGSFAFNASTKILGAAVSIKPVAKGSSEGRVQVELQDAVRDIANVPSGDTIKSFLLSSPRRWNQNSSYFVVLEEIKCGGITYIASRTLLLKAGVSGDIPKTLSGSDFTATDEQGEMVRLVAQFPNGRRAVFYKPYGIVPAEYSLVGDMPARFRVEPSPESIPAPSLNEWPSPDLH